MNKIILISGKQGSGKTTLAEELRKYQMQTNHTRIKEFKFAQIIYDIHNFAIGRLSEAGINRPELKKDGRLLQLLGTEWGRATIDMNVWVKALDFEIQKFFTETKHFNTLIAVVSDCRFQNEFDHFSKMKETFSVRLQCDRKTRKKRCESWRETDTHLSELDLDDHIDKFDIVVNSAEHPVEKYLSWILKEIGLEGK